MDASQNRSRIENSKKGPAHSGKNPLAQLLAAESTFRRFLSRRLGDDALAADLLQQSFVRAVQQQHTLDNAESVVPWFYRVLRNAVVDYYRSRASEARRDAALLTELTVTGADQVPPHDEMRATVCACLHQILPDLRANYADLIRRIDLENDSPEEVAKALGISLNNLTVRLHRARRALRTGLEASCGVCSKHGCLNCTCE